MAAGSPPRARGRVVFLHVPVQALGITPARAGKSLSPKVMRYRSQDHPRACGEEVFSFFRKLVEQGSPPRVRGRGPPLPVEDPRHWITPARAGKSWMWNKKEQRPQDHPRACGEEC